MVISKWEYCWSKQTKQSMHQWQKSAWGYFRLSSTIISPQWDCSFDVGDDCNADLGMGLPGHVALSSWLILCRENPPYTLLQIASLWWPLLKAFTCCSDSALMLKGRCGEFLWQVKPAMLFSKPLNSLWKEQPPNHASHKSNRGAEYDGRNNS